MSQSQPITVPFVESVLHPTDFSPESEKAFAHAIIIAREIAFDRRAKLTIFHVDKEYPGEDEWMKFPLVRTLQRWGILQKDRPRSAVFEELGIGVKKVNLSGHDPLSPILEYLDFFKIKYVLSCLPIRQRQFWRLDHCDVDRGKRLPRIRRGGCPRMPLLSFRITPMA